MNESNEGFDLGPFIAWLEQSPELVKTVIDRLNLRSNWMERLDIREGHHIPLCYSEIDNILGRFPAAARSRSVMGRIIGKPPLWFAKSTTASFIMTTPTVDKALSPTAIIPGHTGNIVWTPEEMLQVITLFAIPGTKPDVAKCISAYALCHEYAHTLLNPLWYDGCKPYVLELPTSGGDAIEAMEGSEFLRRFANECGDYGPVSHYSAVYRPLLTDLDDQRFFTSVSEELCECVAAQLMGFVYRGRASKASDPLGDRPPVQWMVERFLRATLKK